MWVGLEMWVIIHAIERDLAWERADERARLDPHQLRGAALPAWLLRFVPWLRTGQPPVRAAGDRRLPCDPRLGPRPRVCGATRGTPSRRGRKPRASRRNCRRRDSITAWRRS